MKVLSFFSKFTFLCNLAFLVFVIVHKFGRAAGGATKSGMPEFSFFKNLVITLGFSAILINLLMCLTYVIVLILGRKRLLPRWIALVNFLFLLFQFYFYFA